MTGVATLARMIEMSPEEPQGYITGGTFYLNMNRFEESLKMWRLAERYLGPDSQYTPMIQQQIRHTRLGAVSTKRDRVYANGRGNISHAIDLVNEQLSIYKSPRFYFDLGTMHVMRNEVRDESAAAAIQNFQAAQSVSQTAAAGFFRRFSDGGRGGQCPESVNVHVLHSRDGWAEAEVGLNSFQRLKGAKEQV